MSEGALGRWLLIGAGIVVVASIVAGICVMGLPSAQRDERLDQRRVRDLDRIVDAAGSHVRRHRVLPPTLGALAGQPGRRLSIADPVDGAPYSYEVIGERRLRLCAVFATDTGKAPKTVEPWLEGDWLHGAGRQCFEREIRDKPGSD